MTELSKQHDDIDLLLPWYANRTLNDSEARAVEKHLEECSRCRDSLDLLQAMQKAVRAEPATPIIPKPGFADLERMIDHPANRRPGRQRIIGWSLAASVALLGVLVTAFVIRNDRDVSMPALYETATSVDEAKAVGYVFDVTFRESTDTEARQRMLADVGASILSRQQPETYRIIADVPAGSLAALETFTAGLRNQPEVVSVKIVALQLPVKTE